MERSGQPCGPGGKEAPRQGCGFAEHHNHIGHQVHRLHILCKRMVDKQAFGDDMAGRPTRMQSWIIGYLYDHQDQEVFQRDIQEQFSVRRSTVTGILQLMEKNGWITREGVDGDARLKRLRLTPQAMALHERVGQSIQAAEERLAKGLTQEEKETFISLCERIAQNAQEDS